ncbi:MAG: OmpA family protein [Bradymonadaceae bacterium]
MVPATLLQSTDGLDPVVSGGTAGQLSPQGLNDIRVTTKYQIKDLLAGDYGLAAIANIYAPVGTDGTFTSDRGLSFDLLAAAETWLWQGSRVGVNLGYRYRSNTTEFPPATMGDEFLWSVATTIPLFVRRLDLLTEFNGAVSIAADDRNSGKFRDGEGPTEFRTAARLALNSDWVVTAGVGTRIGDGVGAPDVRGFVGIGSYWISGGNYSFDFDKDGIYGEADVCPRDAEDVDRYKDEDGCRDPDNDGDGVLDVNDECRGTPTDQPVDKRGCVDNDIDGDGFPNDEDQCPHDPEDNDEFEDTDGCPDPDNDKDGISDLADKCPNEVETDNGYRDEDGCPDKPGENVRVTDGNVVLNHKVHFETGKAKIQSRSYSLLDQLATLIKKHDEIELLRIEGHTDNQGSKQMNRDLSQRRADSVRNYLINEGVSPERLAATGFGESQPLAPNNTAEGRAKNRRVGFKILKRSEPED